MSRLTGDTPFTIAANVCGLTPNFSAADRTTRGSPDGNATLGNRTS